MSARDGDADPARSAAFYDGIASDYDRQMSGAGDAWTRAAFWDFVDARLTRGARVLDFGCGTGVDAARYAARGYRVLAYDNARAMVDALERRCAGEIARGEVQAWSCPYERFGETLARMGPVDAVTANFAAVNHLPDVGAWLDDAIAPRTLPGAKVLLSSLSACPAWALNDPAFWRRVARDGDRDGVRFAGDAYDHVRYWPWRAGKASRAFRVVSRAGVGALLGRPTREAARMYADWARPTSVAERVERRLWGRWPGWLLGRFTFVELVRRV